MGYSCVVDQSFEEPTPSLYTETTVSLNMESDDDSFTKTGEVPAPAELPPHNSDLPSLRGKKRKPTVCPLCPGQRPYTKLRQHMLAKHKIGLPDGRSNRPCTSKWGLRYRRRICPLCGKSYQRLRDHLMNKKAAGHSVPIEEVGRFMREAKRTDFEPDKINLISKKSDSAAGLNPGSPPDPGAPPPPQPSIRDLLEALQTTSQETTTTTTTVDTEDRSLRAAAAPPPPAGPPERRRAPPGSFLQCPILKAFYKWLGPEAGKDQVSAAQCCKQVRKIWATLDNGVDMRRDTPDFLTLLDEERLREDWLQKCKMAPGTKLSYGYALHKFMEFIIHQKFKIPQGSAQAVQTAWRRWRVHISVAKRKRRTKIQSDMMDKLVTPLELSTVFGHKSIKALEEALIGYDERPKPSDPKSLFHKAQNYLIFRLAVINGQRNSAVRFMTVHEATKAHITPKGAIITVPCHKRDEDGPARLCLHSRWYSQLLGFLLLRRDAIGPELSKNDEMPVFLSLGHTPHTMSASKVHRAVNMCWRMGGQTRDISLTLVRKTVTTLVRAEDPSMREKLAHHMCHSARTADTYYSVQDRFAAFSVMETIVKTLNIDTSVARTRSQRKASESVCGGGDAAAAGAAVAKTSDAIDRKRPPIYHKRRCFSVEESEAALRLLDCLVTKGRAGEPVRKQECLDVLNATDEGRTLLESLEQGSVAQGKDVAKVLADKVRSAFRYGQV